MFENALELLKCNASCSSVCENCLLQYDTNRQVDYLDRMIALSYLQDGFMDLLHLSKEYQFLGSDSFYCDASFEEERNNSAKLFNERITLFLKGDSAMWEIAVSSLKRKLHHIIDRFQNVELVLDQNSFDSLDYDGMKDLWNVMSFWPSKLKLFVSSKYPMLANKGHLLAILTKGLESRSYATSVDEAVNFGTEWGNTSEGILIRSDLYRVSFEPKEISLESLYKASLETIGNAFSINIKRELNGKATEFGKKFWAEMGQKIPTLQTMLRDKKIESVTYEDKYLTSPLTVMLMSNSIKYLHSALGKSFDVTIRTLEPDSRFSRNDEYLHKNYQFGEKSKQRDTISTLSNCGKEVDVILADYGGRTIKLQHARVMTIKFQNGEEVQIRFDQGFGYWRSKENIHFRFDITARQQSAFLLTGEDSRRGRSIMIVNDSDDYPTNITVLISKQQLSV